MQDLRVIVPERDVNTTLSQLGIDFIDLDEPSITPQLVSRTVRGRRGGFKGRSQVDSTELELKIRYRALTKLEFVEMERRVKHLFSHQEKMTIVTMHSYDPLYNYEKIGEFVSGVTQLYELYRYDVVLSDNFKIDRNGLRADITISLETDGIPYRYYTEKTINLAEFDSRKGDAFTYNFVNDGNINQNSREFPFYMEASGMSYKSVRLDINDSSYQSNVVAVTSSVIKFDGYATYLNGENRVKDTNYGIVKINEGANTMIITFTGIALGTPKGFIKFKEYLD